MSDSDSSGLSSVPSDTPGLITPVTVAPVANESKKRKRVVDPATQPKRVARQRAKSSGVSDIAEDETLAQSKTKSPRSYKKARLEIKEEVEAVNSASTVSNLPKKTKRTIKKHTVEVTDEAATEAATPAPKTTPKKTKKTTKQSVKVEEVDGGDGEIAVKVKRKRKTKEEREAEAMPLAARTVGSKVLVGAHVSSAGGVHNAVMNSVHIGGNAFALFLKSQRKWENPPLQAEHLTGFMDGCKEHKYGYSKHTIPPIVPHGSYLVNLAHEDPARTKQAYDVFLEDLTRCARLGIRLYNFHPGNCATSETRSHAITHLAKQLNKAHKDPSSGNVITLLETMTSSTNVIGATFEDLAETIDQIDDKERVGVCLDTCHVFAAGYDLRSPEAFKETIDNFDEIVGLKYLKAFHMNDSKAPLDSGRDLHANIGTGFLGLRAFHNIMNEPRFWGLPMILETPIDVKDEETGKEKPDKSIWATEIKLLESLVGMDASSKEFQDMEAALVLKGTAERQRIQTQVDKKAMKVKEKAEKAAGKGTRKNTKKSIEMSSDEDCSGSEKS